MGSYWSQTSEILDCERTSWQRSHSLEYREDIRSEQIKNVAKLSDQLKLCYKTNTRMGLEYQHWFVTDDTWTIEFGGGEINDAVVTINNRPKEKTYVIEKEFPLEAVVEERIRKVIGASNYSLALRNCEHVARYIQSGVWVSFQMVGSGVLVIYFRDYLTHYTKRINQFPEELKPSTITPIHIYAEDKFTDHPKFKVTRTVLTQKDNNHHNIVFLGPTGAGKSTLINHLYNKTVMPTDDTADSVTKEIYFTQGEYRFHSTKGIRNETGKNINIIDTIGLCDSVLTGTEVYELVRNRVETNLMHIDKVIIVCSGRIQHTHIEAIKQFMKWLNYTEYKDKFTFIYNKASGQTEAKKNINLLAMCSKLGVDTSANVLQLINADGTKKAVNMNCALGFPPDAVYEDVKEDLHTLVWATLSRSDVKRRIPISPESSCTIL